MESYSLLLLLFLPLAVVGSDPEPTNPITLATLRKIDDVSSSKVETLEQAKEYVARVIHICGLDSSWRATADVRSRFETGELAAARITTRLVSDDSIASAFGLLSQELRIPTPPQITAQDVGEYRLALSWVFPHLMKSAEKQGLRPVAAGVLLHLLVFNGGHFPGGVKTLARRGPNTSRVQPDTSTAQLLPAKATAIEFEYQRAYSSYFRERSPAEIDSLIGRVLDFLKF
jgi:hypothetical protein